MCARVVEECGVRSVCALSLRVETRSSNPYSSEVKVSFITSEKVGVARAKGVGEKEKECTTECKSRRRRDEKAPWALNFESGEGGGDEKGRRRGGGEKHAMHV